MPELLQYLAKLTPLAPDHQQHNLAAVEALTSARPDLLQTLSFDTAFHRSLPRLAQLYAIPRALTDAGIIRYGYHGLSYAHLSRHLSQIFPDQIHRRVLALHLGSGASLCALVDGQSVACSMGFSALSGIPMSSRSGDVDPGVLLYLMTEQGMSADRVSELLRKESGLLGVSGISGDLRILEASDRPEAKEAIDLFIYRIVREAGSMIAAMGGLDAVIFTGGIGENSARVRDGVTGGLTWAGAPDPRTPLTTSAHCAVAIVPADEEQEIARGCLQIAVANGKL
jgi:acetate kinase